MGYIMNEVILSILIIGGIGLLIGLFLGLASIKFQVKVDEKEEAVLNALPGINCGSCGYPGCAGLAAAIAKNAAPVNGCPVGGADVAEKVAQIMGVVSENIEKMVAFVRCQGSRDKITMDYEYNGLGDCRMLSYVPNGGPKSCNYGCLGYGSCVTVCQFDAIYVENGLAKVNKDKCVACKKCIDVCPKDLITLVPYKAKHIVSCSSNDKGPVTMKNCTIGCIACQICVKNCPVNAIHMDGFKAVIDQSICIQCGICKDKCPKKCII
jgi:Na+-translocating ferredoxin:NAD+ oxidoreductase subunit B